MTTKCESKGCDQNGCKGDFEAEASRRLLNVVTRFVESVHTEGRGLVFGGCAVLDEGLYWEACAALRFVKESVLGEEAVPKEEMGQSEAKAEETLRSENAGQPSPSVLELLRSINVVYEAVKEAEAQARKAVDVVDEAMGAVICPALVEVVRVLVCVVKMRGVVDRINREASLLFDRLSDSAPTGKY